MKFIIIASSIGKLTITTFQAGSADDKLMELFSKNRLWNRLSDFKAHLLGKIRKSFKISAADFFFIQHAKLKRTEMY